MQSSNNLKTKNCKVSGKGAMELEMISGKRGSGK